MIAERKRPNNKTGFDGIRKKSMDVATEHASMVFCTRNLAFHCLAHAYRVCTHCARLEVDIADLRRVGTGVALGNVPVKLVLERATKIALRARDERCVENGRGQC